MSKYIDERCKECDDYVNECINSRCPIREDFLQSMQEMGEDFEYDRWIKEEEEFKE